MNKTRLALAALSISFLVCLILFPQRSLLAAKEGTQAFLTVVFPSLFPFMVGSTILLGTGIFRKCARALGGVSQRLFGVCGHFFYVFLSAAVSGYPMGAKLCCDLYRRGGMTQTDAARTVNATSLSGPLFISGVVAVSVLGDARYTPVLYLPHLLSALITGLFFGALVYKKTDKPRKTETIAPPASVLSVGGEVGGAILSSVRVLALVGGFVVLFSVIVELLKATGAMGLLTGALSPLLAWVGLSPSLAPCLIAGGLEMSNGVLGLAQAAAPVAQKILAAEWIVTFGGLSVLMQTASLTTLNKIKNPWLLPAKLLQGVIAAALCSFALNGLSVEASAPAPCTPHASPLPFLLPGAAVCAAAVICLLLQKRARRRQPLSHKTAR